MSSKSFIWFDMALWSCKVYLPKNGSFKGKHGNNCDIDAGKHGNIFVQCLIFSKTMLNTPKWWFITMNHGGLTSFRILECL